MKGLDLPKLGHAGEIAATRSRKLRQDKLAVGHHESIAFDWARQKFLPEMGLHLVYKVYHH